MFMLFCHDSIEENCVFARSTHAYDNQFASEPSNVTSAITSQKFPEEKCQGR